MPESAAVELYQKSFGLAPEVVVRAPGRVNLIGDHTDYADGFVLPMAIDREVVIAAGRRDDTRVVAHSTAQPDPATFDLAALTRGTGWGEYLKGVAFALDIDPATGGWQGAVASNVPGGAGLSSSAALEVAVARVFVELSGDPWDPTLMALAAQRAENEWVGMNSGIMDQLISTTGRAGHARLIDCRSLTGRDVPLIPGCSVVVLDTATRRRLIGSAYNERRASCEAAAAELGVPKLRDASLDMLAAKGMLPMLEQRARHVITENERTLLAAQAFEQGDAAEVGRLMSQSHASLRDDFEVSSPALDTMARLAQRQPGCFGARQTGGGFAGSCVALVESNALERFVDTVAAGYASATGLKPDMFLCDAVDGASVV